MRLPDYLCLSVALCRAREAGHTITDKEVLAECEAWGIDPAPVMILVLGQAPFCRWGLFRWPDGTGEMVPYRDGNYVSLDEYPKKALINTKDMKEAVALRDQALEA